MRNSGLMTLLAVAVGMLLAACVSSSATKPGVDRSELSKVCPRPTSREKLLQIASYLEKAPDDPGLDLLATEWERLNDGAIACKAAAK